MTDISPRTVAIVVAALNMKRLYWANASDPQVRGELGALARVAYEWHQAHADVRPVGVDTPPEPPSEMTAQQAAQTLGISIWAARRALRSGRLDGTKRGRDWAVTARSVAEYAQEASSGLRRTRRAHPRRL